MNYKRQIIEAQHTYTRQHCEEIAWRVEAIAERGTADQLVTAAQLQLTALGELAKLKVLKDLQQPTRQHAIDATTARWAANAEMGHLRDLSHRLNPAAVTTPRAGALH